MQKKIDERTNILETFTLSEALRLAKKQTKEGSTEEARLIYKDILDKFPKNKRAFNELNKLAHKQVENLKELKEPPITQLQEFIELFNQGQFKQTIDKIKPLLHHFPASAILRNIKGAAERGMGNIDAAIEAYKNAIEIKPDYPDAYNNLGVALKEKFQLKEAVSAYNSALSIKPDYPDALNNLGNALKEQGQLEAAIKSYHSAIEFKPDFAEAYNNLGLAFIDLGNIDKAISCYGRAIDIKPNYHEAYTHLGDAFVTQAKNEQAINAYITAINMHAGDVYALHKMSNLLRYIRFTSYNPVLDDAFITILAKQTIATPSEIAKSAISLLKHKPELAQIFKANFLRNLGTSFDETITALSNSQLLIDLMKVCPLPNLELERLFCTIRRHILLNFASIPSTTNLLKFQSALALQCYTNEYIYDCTCEETTALRDLEIITSDMIKRGKDFDHRALLCLASYRPLKEYSWHEAIPASPVTQAVVNRQVIEPLEERKLKLQIDALGNITERVSQNVRNQYEENPYPRWINLGLPIDPIDLSKLVEVLQLRLSNLDTINTQNPKILVAGCGTGKHSIQTAMRFKNSKVLAVDMSLSSLAYAKRKTNELNINNLVYKQADILNLKNLNREFDIIECAGVLHHMADPMLGWRVLVDCLKTGGLMRIALYSKLARQSVIEYRASTAGIVSHTKEQMLKIRSEIISSKNTASEQIKTWNDFYSTSELRDLLFHVQEHQFTLPQIQKWLDKLGLDFCGFEAPHIVDQFRSVFPEQGANYDLNMWHNYEEQNPNTFIGMYQFWVQKA